MRLCEIEWVDAAGKPTPDTNEAVCHAVSTITFANGEVVRRHSYCCAEHAKTLDDLVARGLMKCGLGSSRWTREPLA